jgi:hypothetical protein
VPEPPVPLFAAGSVPWSVLVVTDGVVTGPDEVPAEGGRGGSEIDVQPATTAAAMRVAATICHRRPRATMAAS